MAGDDSAQTFTFETMAVVVATLLKKGVNLGMNDYKVMAQLDGSRGASGFDHMFRKVKARAKEINAENGGDAPDTPSEKKTGGSKTSTPAKKGEKTGKKRARKNDAASVDDADDEEASPSKQLKLEEAEEDFS